MTQGRLYLLPAPLGEADQPWLLPHDAARIQPLQYFIAEAPKTARRHLKALNLHTPLQQLKITTYNIHSNRQEIPALLAPLLAGEDGAIISEAGVPCVADPGADIVLAAHQAGIEVQPLVGASSILLALMASGANGQQFAFKGYLPSHAKDRITALTALQKRIQQQQETQIFIETPYRNQAMLKDIVQNLDDDIHLAIAVDLTLKNATIISKTIGQWRHQSLPDLHKRPTVFVLFAPTVSCH